MFLVLWIGGTWTAVFGWSVWWVFLVILGGLLPRLFGWWFQITCIELIECFYVVLCFGFMFLLERSMKQILSCPSVTDDKLPLNKTNCSLTQLPPKEACTGQFQNVNVFRDKVCV